ncbi:MAG: hypothetical protein L0Y38_07590 [Methylococcaceae bacterium]|nr:hypothetical protein [Methylococcaceae bacterium]MCI0733669.1 hypothetical protein [Methylococcaceae bacterium]
MTDQFEVPAFRFADRRRWNYPKCAQSKNWDGRPKTSMFFSLKWIERRTKMRQLLTAALTMLVLSFFAANVGLAAEDHAAEALKHAEQAVEHGKMGHADVLVQHAKEATTHAEAAQKEKANEHMATGITHLQAAIEHGDMNHADVATKHAEEAVTHIKQAQ